MAERTLSATLRSFRIPPYPRRLTLITILYGMVTFVWLSPDDEGWFVIGLGVGLACLAAAHGVHGVLRLSGQTLPAWLWLPGWALLGGGVGAGSALATAALMLLKTGLHNHVYPDYPLLVILGILARAPAWGLAGALVGVAAALVLSWVGATRARLQVQSQAHVQSRIDAQHATHTDGS
jgi:hypothetical protein